MDLEGSLLDGYVSVGAVAVTLLSGLLQALLLLCFPNYRHFCVAELVKPRFSMDASAFPQVYQRDDGGHLHLGVLLPGFSERDNLSMTVCHRLFAAPIRHPVPRPNSHPLVMYASLPNRPRYALLGSQVNTSEVELVGEVVKLEAPFGAAVDNSNSIAGPFGPFSRTVRLQILAAVAPRDLRAHSTAAQLGQISAHAPLRLRIIRQVKLEHPVDCSSGVESLMKHGIVEFRFQKGFTSDAAVAAGKV
eukprot:scaffold185555_cov34-Tisochrysis_lutea.AAC.3